MNHCRHSAIFLCQALLLLKKHFKNILWFQAFLSWWHCSKTFTTFGSLPVIINSLWSSIRIPCWIQAVIIFRYGFDVSLVSRYKIFCPPISPAELSAFSCKIDKITAPRAFDLNNSVHKSDINFAWFNIGRIYVVSCWRDFLKLFSEKNCKYQVFDSWDSVECSWPGSKNFQKFRKKFVRSLQLHKNLQQKYIY